MTSVARVGMMHRRFARHGEADFGSRPVKAPCFVNLATAKAAENPLGYGPRQQEGESQYGAPYSFNLISLNFSGFHWWIGLRNGITSCLLFCLIMFV